MQLMINDDGHIVNTAAPRLSPEQKKQVLNNNLQRFNLVKHEENGETILVKKPLPCSNCTRGTRLENSVLCGDCIKQEHKRAFPGGWQSRFIELVIVAIIGLIVAVTFHFLAN